MYSTLPIVRSGIQRQVWLAPDVCLRIVNENGGGL